MHTRVTRFTAPVTAALLLLASAAPALAQSLTQAVDAAWQRHPQALSFTARQTEMQAAIDQAGQLTPEPASISLGQKTDRFNNNEGKREWEVEWATPIWLPGQRAAKQTQAQAHAQEMAARMKLLRWQIAGEVREVWWAVAAARAAMSQAKQRLDTAEALAANVQRRHTTGELARVDANLALGEKLAAQSELKDAELALRQAEQAFRHLTGTHAPTPLPEESTQDLSDQAVHDVNPSAEPKHAHPWIEALQAGANVASSRLALVDASRRDAPELSLSWISDRGQRGQSAERSVGIKLTWPLSSSARVRQDSAAARAELAQADAELAQATTRIELDIEQARAALASAEQQLSLAQARQRLAADSLTLAQRSFDLGESDLPALLRARSDSLAASANLAKQDIAQALARSRLSQAQGLLP